MAVADPRSDKAVISSPIPGFSLALSVRGGFLYSIDFVSGDSLLVEPVTSVSVLKRLIAQLDAYFSCSNIEFDIPVFKQGTTFQRQVWRALVDIPSGETKTYGQLAKELNTSARAVGNACRVNPLPIVVPCHRVVSAHGIGGFMGKRQGGELSIKHWLLGHEGVNRELS